MISPILPAHDADTIALDLGVFIACRSREYRCSREAIIAAIHAALPSQPGETSRSHAPAADTSVEPLADVTTDGGDTVAPASPSVAPSTGLRELAQREARQSASTVEAEAVTAHEPVASSPAGSDAAAIPASPSETGKPVEPSGSAAPVPKYELVRQCHNEHPDWPPSKIAEATGVRKDQIHGLAKFAGISIPTEAEYRRALRKQTTEALKAAAEPAEANKPAEPPQTQPHPKQPPVGTAGRRGALKQKVLAVHAEHPDWTAAQIAEHLGHPSKGSISAYLFDARAEERAVAEREQEERLLAEARKREEQRNQFAAQVPDTRTLTERVRMMHQQHPTWTARMIANELGANPNSVSVLLSSIRNPKAKAEPATDPKFNGKRQMLEHYGEVAKRLGKPA